MNEKSPNSLIVFLTEECDQSCHHCKDSRLYSQSTRRFELADIKDRIEKKWPTPEKGEGWFVLITGGEPLLHPHIVEVVQSFQAQSVQRITISTNGKELIKNLGLIGELLAAGLTEVSISTESDAATYETLRGSQDHTALLKWTLYARLRYPQLVISWNVFIAANHMKDGMPWMATLSQAPVHRVKLLPYLESLVPHPGTKELALLADHDIATLQSKIATMPDPKKFNILLPSPGAIKWQLGR